MVGSDWLKSKNWRKNKEKRDKNNFFKLYFPHSLVFYLMAKFKHCSVRQSKVTAENVQHARDLVVNHLGCDIWDMTKFVFYPKKCRQFHRWSLHNIMSLYGLFIAFIQCILSSGWLWNSYCSSVCSCPQHVFEWPCEQVGPKQLLCCQEEIALIQWWFRVIVENSWAQRVEAIDLFFIQK